MTRQKPAAPDFEAALAELESGAVDLGNNGVDPTYGKGLVGSSLHPGRVISVNP